MCRRSFPHLGFLLVLSLTLLVVATATGQSKTQHVVSSPPSRGCQESAKVINAVVPGKVEHTCPVGTFIEAHELELDSVLVTCRCDDPLGKVGDRETR